MARNLAKAAASEPSIPFLRAKFKPMVSAETRVKQIGIFLVDGTAGKHAIPSAA